MRDDWVFDVRTYNKPIDAGGPQGNAGGWPGTGNIRPTMPAWRKLQLVEDANRTAAHLAMMGLRDRHPGESIDRLRRRLVGLTLGEDLATKVYGSLDAIE